MPFSARQGFFHQADTGPALWTPAEITTLVWLDAFDGSELTLDGTDVSTWNNKSGGLDFTQGTSSLRPTYDSTNKCVTFDGSTEYMDVATKFVSVPNPDYLCVMLTNYLSLNTDSDRLFQLENGVSQECISIGHGGSGRGWNWRHNNGFSAHNSGATTGLYMTSWQRSAGEPYADDRTWENGTSLSRTSSSGDSINSRYPSITVNYTSLGRGQGGGSPGTLFYSNARVHELVFAEIDSTDTRQKLEGYMAWRWGEEDNLPVDHPYKSAAPTI